MAKKILAVSGGVDSMVMMEMFKDDDVVVAHFDHGTRPSSRDDAEFVRKEAQKRGLVCRVEHEELGEGVSEEVARKSRYEFLMRVSKDYEDAEIYTAHHLDDLVETVAINLLRGTGWRGLAGLSAERVRRPFLELELLPKDVSGPLDRKAIMSYSAKHDVVFREDPTNSSDEYLRNRIRHQMNNFSEKMQIYQLWTRQKRLRTEIDDAMNELLPQADVPWRRDWFCGLDEQTALEILRAGTLRSGVRATRPQLENFRQAILNYASGAYFNLPKDRLVKFTKTSFEL